MCPILQSLNYLCGPLLNSQQYVHVSVVLGREALVPALQIYLTSPEQRGKIHSLDLLEVVFPNAAHMLLTLFAPKVVWRLMVNLMSARNLRPFSASFLLVSSQSVLLSSRALHFPLLNCKGWCWPISAACPHPRVAACLPGLLAATSNTVSSSSFLKVDSCCHP